MNDRQPFTRFRSTKTRRRPWIVAGLLLVACGGFALPFVRDRGWIGPRPSTSLARRSAVYDVSPYKNAKPDIAYVGDAACTRCHQEIAESYREHPMGRSLTAISSASNLPATKAAQGIPFDSQGLTYSVLKRDGRMFHKATRRDGDGKVLSEIDDEVHFALGSGTRGSAYLIERDGSLFQSPIAWFAQGGHWGISPGYGEANPRPNFERTIQTECLFCHTNQVRHEAGTLNRYQPPIFDGHSIGCERCHGPGELHVNSGSPFSGDLTIVNPAKLPTALRDSVCQQCHLQGWFRFPRAGRDFFDFRPGLPLHRFLAVFAKTREQPGKFELIGQAEQMEASRCFKESKGRLGCISCHDPHRRPDPATKVAHYRKRCLECHETAGCSLPIADRQARGQADNCVACHMRRSNVTSVPHVAETDHRISRGVTGATDEAVDQGPGLPLELTPRDYHWTLMDAQERQASARDMGIALESVARITRGAPRLATLAASQALPMLQAAAKNDPEDLAARESLAYALETIGRTEAAGRVYEEILRINPGRELTLHSMARTQARAKRPEAARSALEKVIAIDPWRSDYRLALANVCFQAGDWPAAIKACREAIKINPELYEARSLLIQCDLRTGELGQANAEFEILVRFSPASGDMWRRWYAEQQNAAKTGASTRSGSQP